MNTLDYCVGELSTVRIGDDMTGLPEVYADCDGEGSGDSDCGCDMVDGS